MGKEKKSKREEKGKMKTRKGTRWCDIPVLSFTVRVVQSARDLGVILDSQLSLSAHIAALLSLIHI